MADLDLHTAELRAWLDRWRTGRVEARDELLRGVRTRLRRLAGRVTATPLDDDTADRALTRLMVTLAQLPRVGMNEFLQLAADLLRRELLALARSAGRERWIDFHVAVAELPSAQRAVVDLHYYHGWPLTRAAAWLDVTEALARRQWRRALWRASAAQQGALDHA